MSIKDTIEEIISSSGHLSKRHVHPRLLKMFELGGMNAVFTRGEGPYLWDAEGERYLDLLSGGGVHFAGRNPPAVQEAVAHVAAMNLPNLTVTNASILGGALAERLLGLAGSHFGKVVFANSGSEANEVALRFARQVTRRRRFLYLEGAFHGRSYGAISVCGFAEMRENLEPAMPTCTPIQPNNLRQLKKELGYGDVAALIVEPIQGMTGVELDADWLRAAEAVCAQHGTLLIVDEVQTGLGRTGSWFASTAMGVRPSMMTVSKALSGGAVPVAALLVADELYDRVYQGLSSGLVYFSTFAENNLAMAAGIATLDMLMERDAPAEAERRGTQIREGLEELAERWDCIERIDGRGLMLTVRFKDSARPALAAQQKLLRIPDKGAFAAAVHVDLYSRQHVIAQIPGPGVNAIKVLPPFVISDDDVAYFIGSFDDTLAGFYGSSGPIVSLGRGVIEAAAKRAKAVLPTKPPELVGLQVAPMDPGKKKTAVPADLSEGGLQGFSDYTGPIRVSCDFVVVGSGPAGGVLAHTLAASGKRVILVEAGPKLNPSDFGVDFGQVMASWFWEGGMRATHGNVIMPTLQPRVLGGGSVFNSGICMRALPSALENWADTHGLWDLTADDLAPHFDAVEELMGIKPVEADIQGRRNEMFRDACDVLGWDAEPVRRFEQGCVGSAECITGCRTGAKLSLDRRGIPEFVQSGGTVYSDVEIDQLILDDGRARGVVGHIVDPETKAKTWPVRINARCTILAAGAINTPLIARRSGLRDPNVGSRLLFHPSCYVLGVFDEPISPWTGATQGFHTAKFLEHGIKLESLWATASVFAMRLPRTVRQFKRYLKRYDHIAVWDGWVSGDDSVGRVRALPAGKSDLSFDLGAADARRLQETNAKLCELFAAAGAREVLTGIRALPEVMDAGDAAAEIRAARLDVKELPTGSNHVMGGMPMGADPETSATDSMGRVHSASDLYVCDTGLFPSSPAVNPQETAMALAHRLGQRLPELYT